MRRIGTYPTWQMTTPHNILRQTPQAESCVSCHGNADVFLTRQYVEELVHQGAMVPAELEANLPVLADPPPPPP